MSYLNQFVICEDDQFECSGVFKINDSIGSDVDQVQHSIEKYFDGCTTGNGDNCKICFLTVASSFVV